MRAACVTGGAGFIGHHLVSALLARGVPVSVIDDFSTGRREAVPAGARLVEGNILDPAATAAALAGCDTVFHLAARVAIRSSFEFATEDAIANLGGTAAVITAATRAGCVRRIIGTSSMAVYADSPQRTPIDEDHGLAPISPYGISKLAAERLVHVMCAQAGMESAVLRLFNTYGPGQVFSAYVGVVTIFVNMLRRGDRPTVFGDGTQCRDFVHVEDVVNAYLLAAEGDTNATSFNIGSGQGLSVNDVLRAVQGAMHSAIEPVYAAPAPGELLYSVADISRAHRLLGYDPARDFRACVHEVVADILGN